MKTSLTHKRKSDHIEISLNENISSSLTTGLGTLRFTNQALPELDLKEIDPSRVLLDKKLSFPLLISSMTGGTPRAAQINRNLAKAAEEMKVCLALGSQRAAIEDPALAKTFKVREFAPSIPIFANLGAVQLNYGFSVDECKRAVDMVQADGLILHLNPLQEALQPEGETNFRGLVQKIQYLHKNLECPIIIKEVGFGISTRVAKMLSEAGVWAVDVAGAGGTSWSQVEKFRAENSENAQVADAFRNWGISTVESIRSVKNAAPKLKVFASGGLRSGVDMAKCIALGADMCGIALPFLKSATISSEAVEKIIGVYYKQFRIAMFAAGIPNLKELSRTPLQRS
jgi:isopentenyl-diphosphate Delta-isomerase